MSRGQRSSGPLLGRGPKLIGSLIGAGTEAYAHHKEKKAAQDDQAQTQQAIPTSIHRPVSPGYPYDDDEMLDEEDWALDEASAELAGKEPHYSHAASSFAQAPTMPRSAMKPLPYPVILPQRRPQTKSRGFVRAYAPLLGECKGIDETTFLHFLDEFYEKTQASQYLQAINVASGVVGMAPSVVAMAISTAMSIGARSAIEVQGRYKTNTYLDQANEQLFNPRNLHCVIMTFKPESSQEVVEVDVNATNEALVKSMDTPSESKLGKIRNSYGTSKGEFAIPEAAPLVYPTLDKVASEMSEDGAPQKQSTYKRSSAFVANYLDRRAQAEYSGTQGEDSRLSVPGATDGQKFASRYSDPNHPANSGGILALLTGGAVDPRAKSLVRRADRQARFTGQELSEQDRHNIAMGRGAPGGRQGILRSVRKMMKEDVLYLIIAEIPSREQMDETLRMRH
jgi:hypothetical protein